MYSKYFKRYEAQMTPDIKAIAESVLEAERNAKSEGHYSFLDCEQILSITPALARAYLMLLENNLVLEQGLTSVMSYFDTPEGYHECGYSVRLEEKMRVASEALEKARAIK